MRALGYIGMVALALAVPAGSATSSGLRGLVTRGPITPVCHEGTSCVGPAKRVVLTFVRNGRTETVRTGADGRYRVLLTPGTWAVRIPTGRFGYRPRLATVRAGVISTVNFTIDTGIR